MNIVLFFQVIVDYTRYKALGIEVIFRQHNTKVQTNIRVNPVRAYYSINRTI